MLAHAEVLEKALRDGLARRISAGASRGKRNRGELVQPLSQPAEAKGLSSLPSTHQICFSVQAIARNRRVSAESKSQVFMATVPKEGIQDSTLNRKAACMTCPDPEKLCKYYQSGTAKDFESFVQNSEVWIFRKARDLIRGSVPGKYELAEDVTWIVIEKVCDSRESKPWLPEKGSLKNWLYSLIRNQIASYLRVKSNQMRPFSDYLRENEVGELCSIEQQQVDERAIPPLEAMIQAERLEQARALFAQLPPLTRQVVTLYYDEGLTFRQIAAEIGTHTSSVFRHVASAREKFALLVASERLAA